MMAMMMTMMMSWMTMMMMMAMMMDHDDDDDGDDDVLDDKAAALSQRHNLNSFVYAKAELQNNGRDHCRCQTIMLLNFGWASNFPCSGDLQKRIPPLAKADAAPSLVTALLGRPV